MFATARLALAATVLAALACDDEPSPAAPSEPATPSEPAAPTPQNEAPVEPNEEACVLGVVVAWDGATPTPPGVTRTEEEARARAQEMLRRVEAGTPLTDVARAESDAPTSRARGGAMGTWRREEWPDLHAALLEPIFALGVGQHTDVVRAPYGFVIAERCPVEKVHTRHILIRYAGARNASSDVTRSREEARALAEQIRAEVIDGADFAAVARERSEDGSAERGGDLGEVGRGMLMPAYEDAAFRLSPMEISEVVETAFGFHIIQSL